MNQTSALRFFSIRLIFGLPLLLLMLFSCDSPEKLPDTTDYAEFITQSADLMCHKIQRCYIKFYRTLSPEMQQRISLKRCRKSALRDLDTKLARHTPRMKILSAICYEAILDSPCKRFAVVAIWHPACLQLRRETDRVLASEVSAKK